MARKKNQNTPASRKGLTQEIASVARMHTAHYGGNVLPNTDETLRTRGGGKGLRLYAELKRDAHCGAVLQKRRLAVVTREWHVDPASEAPADVRAAERVRAQLDALGFDRVCENLLEAVLTGYAVAEVIWEARENELAVAAVKARWPGRFVFGVEGRPRLLTREAPAQGIELPERKFIVHTHGGMEDSPYGLGLGSTLFWPVFFKRQGITFWLTFADKFGNPTAVGKYPLGASATEQAKLLAALESLSHDTGVTIPEGMVIELLEAQRSGTVNTHDALCRYMDEQISEAVLGETLTTNVGATGSLAAGQIHNEVREEIAKADADLLSAVLNHTLARWITELNDPAAAPPTVWRDFTEPEDLDARATRDKTLHDMGLEPEDATYWERVYGERWVKRAGVNGGLVPNAPPDDGKVPSFAEGDLPAPEQLTTQAEDAAGQVLDGLLAPVRQLVETAATLEALRDGLLALYPGLDAGAFADLMQRALVAAELTGRGDVVNGA